MSTADEPRPALLECPECRGTTTAYCTLNDRFALCPPCAERVREKLTVLTPAALARGIAAAAVTALVVCIVANTIVASLGTKSDAAGWVQSIASVFMGATVGRMARKASVVGGRLLQVATVAIALFAVLEMFAGSIYALVMEQPNPPLAVVALAEGIVLSPVYYVIAIASGQIILLFWLFWAIYDPWRATRALAIEVKGPFPVQVSQAPPPAADAKAAGMDFERPT